jgi:hypothetical protein
VRSSMHRNRTMPWRGVAPMCGCAIGRIAHVWLLRIPYPHGAVLCGSSRRSISSRCASDQTRCCAPCARAMTSCGQDGTPAAAAAPHALALPCAAHANIHAVAPERPSERPTDQSLPMHCCLSLFRWRPMACAATRRVGSLDRRHRAFAKMFAEPLPRRTPTQRCALSASFCPKNISYPPSPCALSGSSFPVCLRSSTSR